MLFQDDSINQIVQKEKKKSLIKPGEDYNLDHLKDERTRIDDIIKKQWLFLLQSRLFTL